MTERKLPGGITVELRSNGSIKVWMLVGPARICLARSRTKLDELIDNLSRAREIVTQTEKIETP